MIDFSLPADQLAPLLLNCHLAHAGVTLRITEVEAYLDDDPASHAFVGKTGRNQAMFGPPGRMYVYVSYGIHHLGNIVSGPEGVGQGCLLRAGEIIAGEDIASRRRGHTPHHRLAQGPGNLGKALALDLTHNGQPVTGPDFVLTERTLTPDIATGPRVGISKNIDAPLRFYIPGDPSVSRQRGSSKSS